MNSSNTPIVAIRHSTPADVPLIHAVVKDAFAQEDEARLVAAIRLSGDATIELIAFLADELVDHVLLSPIRIEPATDLKCLGIAPLSVSPRIHGKGVGSLLMRRAINEAEARSIDALFLLGAPAYYQRFGFTQTHIGNEYGATAAFLALELAQDCLAEVEGIARYVDAFSDTGV